MAAAIAATLALSGCAVAEVEATEQDENAVALLDQSSGEIIMPLDDYLFDSFADAELINRAIAIDVGQCMESEGFVFTSDDVVEDPESTGEDRTYGLWDVARAARFGFGYAPSLVDQAFDADAALGGASWLAQYELCSEQVQSEADYLPSNEFLNESLPGQIRTEAYRAASRDEEWDIARSEWQSCLESVGLTPGGSDNQWTSQQATNSELPLEEQISVATREAQCNNDTQLTQRLANLEASYQQPLIDEFQAALNEVLEQKQEYLDAAREIVESHG